jgi:hypothetical protein
LDQQDFEAIEKEYGALPPNASQDVRLVFYP